MSFQTPVDDVLRACWLGTLALGILLAAPVRVAVAASPSPPKSCTLLVTLLNKPFSDESGVPVVPLTFDARIAIRAVIDEVVLGSCGFAARERVVFLIHSPSMTFGGYWFHDKQFFVTLRASDEAETGRRWDLVGLDWPLTTLAPSTFYLLCSGSDHVVRTQVGDENQILGPFSVFVGGRPLISLSTVEVVRAHPHRGHLAFSVEYPGDPGGAALKPAFHFSTDHSIGSLLLGDQQIDLRCEWPSGKTTKGHS